MFLNPKDYTELCRLLDYQFKKELLLQQAITRKSGFLEGKQEKHVGHNERLEFFGDSILRTVIDDILMELYPTWGENQLSEKRDELVTKKGVLFQFAVTINLHKFIIMGNGELVNFEGNGRNKILSDVMEAIIGAVFIDSDKNYLLLKTFIIKHCKFQKLYNESLIKAILEENVSQVECFLKAGADPNATGSTTIFKYSIGDFIENKYTGEKQWVEKQWGEDKITLFYGEYEDATALQLAMVSNRVVPPIALRSTKPGPGRNAYIKNGFIYAEPLRLQSKNPTLQDIFATMAHIDLGGIHFGQNLELEPNQPGYQLLQKFFESDISPNCLRILQLLLKHGADPNKQHGYGETALHVAAHLGNTDIVELLLQHKADITITNREGNIPALEAKNSRVAKLLSPIVSTERKPYKPNSNDVFFKPNFSRKPKLEEKSLQEPEVSQNYKSGKEKLLV